MTRSSFCLMLAGLIAAPIVVLAHEGHVHKTMGTVTTIHENHVEVKDVKGVVTMHELNAKTKIRRGRAVLKIADIKVGDRVVVSTLESKDKATGKVVKNVTEVQVGAVAATAKKK